MTNPNRIGDIAEYKAIVWLLSHGYEVFANTADTGPIDMIAIKDNEIKKIDVKTAQIRDGDLSLGAKSYLTQEQLEQGIVALFVYGDTVGWNRDYFPVIIQ